MGESTIRIYKCKNAAGEIVGWRASAETNTPKLKCLGPSATELVRKSRLNCRLLAKRLWTAFRHDGSTLLEGYGQRFGAEPIPDAFAPAGCPISLEVLVYGLLSGTCERGSALDCSSC